MDRRLNQKGFTLLEVMAGIMMFAFGVLALYKLQAAGVRGNTFANELTLASTLAQNQMEVLKGLEYNDPLHRLDDTDGNGIAGLDSTTAADHSAVVDTTGPPKQYTVHWNVAVGDGAAGNPIKNTKKIRVIVTWVDQRDETRRVAYNCIKFDII